MQVQGLAHQPGSAPDQAGPGARRPWSGPGLVLSPVGRGRAGTVAHPGSAPDRAGPGAHWPGSADTGTHPGGAPGRAVAVAVAVAVSLPPMPCRAHQHHPGNPPTQSQGLASVGRCLCARRPCRAHPSGAPGRGKDRGRGGAGIGCPTRARHQIEGASRLQIAPPNRPPICTDSFALFAPASGSSCFLPGTPGTNAKTARNPLSALNKTVPGRDGDKRLFAGDSRGQMAKKRKG